MLHLPETESRQASSLPVTAVSLPTLKLAENKASPGTHASSSEKESWGPHSAHRVLARSLLNLAGCVTLHSLPLAVLRVTLGFLQYTFIFWDGDVVKQDSTLSLHLH